MSNEQIVAITSAVLGLALVNLSLLAVILVRARGAANGARCGACGHSATGLRGAICPECGAQFRRSGILTGRLRSGVRTWQLVVGLMVASGIVFGASLAVVQMELAKRYPPGMSTYQASASFSLNGSHVANTPGSQAAEYRLECILPISSLTLDGRELPASLYPDALDGQPAYLAVLPVGNTLQPTPLDLDTAAEQVLMPGQIGPVLVIPDVEDVAEEEIAAWLDELELPWTERARERLDEHTAELADVIGENARNIAAGKGAMASGELLGGVALSSQYIGMIDRAPWVGAIGWLFFGGLFLVSSVAIGRWGARRRARIRERSA